MTEESDEYLFQLTRCRLQMREAYLCARKMVDQALLDYVAIVKGNL